MSLTQRINTTRPLAVCGITAWCGIGVFELTDDYAITAFYDGSRYVGPRRRPIYYTTCGRPFLRIRNARYYLDEFIRLERIPWNE